MAIVHNALSVTRRGALTAGACLLGAGTMSLLFPKRAHAVTPRNTATGTYETFQVAGISGGASTGFEYVPRSRLTQSGAVSSGTFRFGAGSVRFRMNIKGPQRTVAEFEGTNASPGNTVSASYTTYDVNNKIDGGYFYGFFFPDVYVENVGFVFTGASPTVFCSMYENRSAAPLSVADSAVHISGIQMLPRTGDSGLEGYVRLSDYIGPDFESPEECLEFYQEHDYREIDVFDSEGINVVDTLTIHCGVC